MRRPGDELIGIANEDLDALHFFTDVGQYRFHCGTVTDRHGIFNAGIGGSGKIQTERFHEFNGVFFAKIKIQDNLKAHDQGYGDDNGRHYPVAQFFPNKVGQAVLDKVFYAISHLSGACYH